MRFAIAVSVLTQRNLPTTASKGFVVGSSTIQKLSDQHWSSFSKSQRRLILQKQQQQQQQRQQQPGNVTSTGTSTGILKNQNHPRPFHPLSSSVPDVGILSLPRQAPRRQINQKSRSMHHSSNNDKHDSREADVGILAPRNGILSFPSFQQQQRELPQQQNQRRSLQSVPLVDFCDPSSSLYKSLDCNCDNFNMETGAGVVSCWYTQESYCFNSTDTDDAHSFLVSCPRKTCTDLLVSNHYEANNTQKVQYEFCYSFVAPYRQLICLEYYVHNDNDVNDSNTTCQLSMDGTQCQSCQVGFFNVTQDDDTANNNNSTSTTTTKQSAIFDCTNVNGGKQGDFITDPTAAFPILDACTSAPTSAPTAAPTPSGNNEPKATSKPLFSSSFMDHCNTTMSSSSPSNTTATFCNCDDFDMTTGTGTIACDYFKEDLYCFSNALDSFMPDETDNGSDIDLEGKQDPTTSVMLCQEEICTYVAVSYSYQAFAMTTFGFCYHFQSPYEQVVCLEYLNSTSCQITLNGNVCQSCQRQDNTDDTSSVMVNCTNVPGGNSGDFLKDPRAAFPILQQCTPTNNTSNNNNVGNNGTACNICPDGYSFHQESSMATVTLPWTLSPQDQQQERQQTSMTCGDLYQMAYTDGLLLQEDEECQALPSTDVHTDCCHKPCNVCRGDSNSNNNMLLSHPKTALGNLPTTLGLNNDNKNWTCGDLYLSGLFQQTIPMDTCDNVTALVKTTCCEPPVPDQCRICPLGTYLTEPSTNVTWTEAGSGASVIMNCSDLYADGMMGSLTEDTCLLATNAGGGNSCCSRYDYCDVCGSGQYLQFPNETLLVPGEGENFSCRDLYLAGLNALIAVGYCPIIHDLASSTCCLERETPDPSETFLPVIFEDPPTEAPENNSTAPSISPMPTATYSPTTIGQEGGPSSPSPVLGEEGSKICNICGMGNMITLHNDPAEVPTFPKDMTCAQLQAQANGGGISSLACDLMIPFTQETCGCIPAVPTVSPAPTIPDVAWQTSKEPQPTPPPTPTSGSVFDNTDATLENGDTSSSSSTTHFLSWGLAAAMGLWAMAWN